MNREQLYGRVCVAHGLKGVKMDDYRVNPGVSSLPRP